LIVGWLFFFFDAPPCFDAMDVGDNNQINITDCMQILNHAILGLVGAPSPAPPFPEPGPDTTPGGQFGREGCDSYGGGAALEDPGAKLAIVNASAQGGVGRRATLTVALSSSVPLAAFSCQIRYAPGLVGQTGEYPDGVRCLIAGDRPSLAVPVGQSADLASFGFLFVRPLPNCHGDGFECAWIIPPGQDVPVLEIDVCIAEGTPAGEYPLALEAGELTEAVTGRAIYPVLEGGTLTVLEDAGSAPCEPNPPPPPAVIFKLADRAAPPGGSATVPFSIQSTLPSQGFSFSIDFDEEVLEATEIERLFDRPSGMPYEFQKFELNDDNEQPGNTGIAEGYLVGAAIISLTDTQDVLPPGVEVPVLDLNFLVRPGVSATQTEIRFVDGGMGSDGVALQNQLISSGKPVTPATASSFLFVDAILRIVPDGIPFVRGDANADGMVSISDPISTLGHLFLDSSRLPCPDAADVNDDGILNISDPIYALGFLFLGGPAPPAPYPEPGQDTTGDGMVCSGSGS
jgi:hypothetical protein